MLATSKRPIIQKTSHRIRTLLLIGLSAILIPALLITGYHIAKNATQAQTLTTYLEAKYNKKFKVMNIRYEGGGIGMPGQPIADAYAVNNKEVKFEVGETGSNSPEKKYYDTYIKTLWSHEAQSDDERAVKSIFNDSEPWISIEVYPYSTTTGRENRTSNLYNSLPTLAQQFEKDRSGLNYSLHIRTTGSFDDTDKAKHLARLNELIKFVSDKKTGEGHVRYVVNVDNENSMYVCSISNRPLIYPIDSSVIGGCFKNYNAREE